MTEDRFVARWQIAQQAGAVVVVVVVVVDAPRASVERRGDDLVLAPRW